MPSRGALLAQKLIAKKGRAVLLRFNGADPVADPTKPWRNSEPEYETIPTIAVFLDTETTDLLARVTAVSRLVRSPVEVDKTVALVPGTIALAPEINMALVDGTKVWQIKRVGVLEPGADGPALFTLLLGN
jgi:hypothetical protein